MYIVFDFRCTQCGHQESRIVRREEMEEQRHRCAEFNTKTHQMIRLPAGTRTNFRFNDTKLKR